MIDFDLGGGFLPFQDLVLRLAAATLLGALIGVERERLERAAGLRTHALVSVASALIMIVSTYGFPTTLGDSQIPLDPSRIAAQVVSGIGFLGAGVIIFRENTMRGLTTAASIWSVAGVGLAAGGGLYIAATTGTVFMLLILAGMRPLEQRFFSHQSQQHRILIETRRGPDILEAVQEVMRGKKVRLRSLEFDRSQERNADIIEITLVAEDPEEIWTIVAGLRRKDGVDHIAYRRGSARIRQFTREGIGTNGDDDDDANGNGH